MKRKKQSAKELHTKIRGVTLPEPYTNIPRQKLIKKYVRKGTELIPYWEKDNPKDPLAVALYLVRKPCFICKKRRYHLGYLGGFPGKLAATLIEHKTPFRVIVSSVTGGTRKKPTRGVNLRLIYET